MEVALVLVGVALIPLFLHGARVGFCDPSSGLMLFGLGPTMGAFMGATWGFVVGQLMRLVPMGRLRQALTALFALAGPVIGIAISLGRFFTSPMVFAYDPFFGYFSGTLYDTVVTDSLSTLLTYRAGSLATLFAVGAAVFCVKRPEKGWLRLADNRHPGVLWAAVTFGTVSLIISLEGGRLGHWQTADTIEDALGAKVVNERCEVVYPRTLDDETARLLLYDCATQSRRIIAYLGVERAPRVRVYVFADREQKRKLTGAFRVSVAKPWRKEVYVQLDTYPHSVLGHELAHVLAGTFALGPFRVAGAYGGWLPDPGLIEGIAVAASPNDDVLTPQQWSAAMLKLDALPALSNVFALGFLGENSSKAYTVAGAFVHWVRERYGKENVRRWYAGESLEAVTGKTLETLEKEWHEELAKLDVSQASLDYAKARFERPGVFMRHCPHAVDAFNRDGQMLAREGDCTTATLLFEQAVLLDANHARSRLNLASCSARVGGVVAAEEQWRSLAEDATLPEPTRLYAQESMADLYLSLGRPKAAEEIYESLLTKVVNEGRLRTIDIKLRASRNPFEARAIRALLLGKPGQAPNHRLAFSLLGRWMTEVPSDGLPAYLIGKNLVNTGSWQAAGEFLDWALERELPQPRVMNEALRLRIIVACAQRDETVARRMFTRWKAQLGLQESRWRVLQGRLGSCLGQLSN
ncbi:MAG: hypothetical protein CSA75_01150 [Sorangium cellulosum]|nr:MAG: hypothetical protein CSA75_01150 [Sorangium cellulosum]